MVVVHGRHGVELRHLASGVEVCALQLTSAGLYELFTGGNLVTRAGTQISMEIGFSIMLWLLELGVGMHGSLLACRGIQNYLDVL